MIKIITLILAILLFCILAIKLFIYINCFRLSKYKKELERGAYEIENTKDLIDEIKDLNDKIEEIKYIINKYPMMEVFYGNSISKLETIDIDKCIKNKDKDIYF